MDVDHIGGEPVSVKKERDGRAALCDLIDDYLARHGVSAAAAILLGEVNAHEPRFAELLVNVPVKAVFIHPFVERLDLIFGELSHHVADHDLLFCELEHFYFSFA